jgi:hypothetical protein
MAAQRIRWHHPGGSWVSQPGPRYAPMSNPSPQDIAALAARIEAAERALDQLFAKARTRIARALSTLDR